MKGWHTIFLTLFLVSYLVFPTPPSRTPFERYRPMCTKRKTGIVITHADTPRNALTSNLHHAQPLPERPDHERVVFIAFKFFFNID